MSRWQPNARDRLAVAALELYAEHGFDRTTVHEIADRAGLTERTFFRHFADKREVLFGGSEVLVEEMTTAVGAAPADAAPRDLGAAALDGLGRCFPEERRDYARRRQAVIAGNTSLLERELLKRATLVTALTDALRARGVTDPAAGLVAESVVAVFHLSFVQWIEGGGETFPAVLTRVYDELRAATA